MIIRRHGKVDAKLLGQECRKLLALTDAESLTLPPPPPPKSLKKRLAVADGYVGDDGGDSPKRKPKPIMDAIEGGDGDASSRSSSSSAPSPKSGETSSSSSGSSHDGDGSDDDAPFIPKQIAGRRVRVEVRDKSGDRGLRITRPTHGFACRKFRSLSKDIDLYGHKAAFF